jgi:hypothetical protein
MPLGAASRRTFLAQGMAYLIINMVLPFIWSKALLKIASAITPSVRAGI